MAKSSKKLEDAQKTWEDKINRSKKVRKNWKDLFKVDLIREFLDGKQNPGYPENEWITVNKLYSHLKAQLPALYSVDPYFYVKLRRSYKPDPLSIVLYEQKGKIRQAFLNYEKEEVKLKEKARLGIADAHCAYGVLKIHYHADMVDNPDAGIPMMGDSEEPLIDDNGNPLIGPERIPIHERYRVSRVHPDDFLWDEDAGPLEDNWHWVAQCIRIPYEEAIKDWRFDKKAMKKLEGKTSEESSDDERKQRETRKKGDIKGRSEDARPDDQKKKRASQILVLWEIYEINREKWHVIAEDGEIPLMYDESFPPGIEKHPFAILRFTLRDDSPYPHPPLSPGIDPQKEYNLARSRILTHRKRFNRKYEASKVALGQNWAEEVSKLESGEDGTVIIKEGGTDGQAIYPIQDAPLDQMGYMEIGYLNQDLIEVLGGTHDEARGLAGAESATQASILDKRLEMKEGDSMSMVVDWITDVARKLDQLVQTHITKDEAVMVSGPQGEYWELVKTTDYEKIEGEYEYKVNVGATIPRMPHVERAQWMAFLTLLGSFPQLMLSPSLMKKMAEMHHIEDEKMLDELLAIAKKMMGGQIPMPGNSGSQSGVPEERPASAQGGMAGGMQSLFQPMAGNG